jgi:TorA maturation chaperone TorD
MDQNEHQEIEDARGTLYGFFSGLFRKALTSKEVGRILDEQTASVLQSLFHGCGAEKAFKELKQSLEESGTCMEELLMDYEALFRVPGRQFVHPYESAYRTSMTVKDNKTRPVMNVSFTEEVKRVYESEGLETAPGFDENADHLATELEYMANLCRIRATHIGQGNREEARLYEKKQNAFLCEHLDCWADPCLKNVEENASTPFYRTFAGFLRSFLEEERGREERQEEIREQATGPLKKQFF